VSLRLPARLEAVLRSPSWPASLERPPVVRNIGRNYDTEWTRTPLARAARAGVQEGMLGPLTRLVTSPKIYGLEHLEPLRGAVIFAGNHSSHLDTGVMLSSIPVRFRRRLVVAAAADYFFDRSWKATLSSFVLGAIPIDRLHINRQSVDVAAGLIEEGYSLIIFPEGGRSPDGWGQEFTGGAAYLAKRCGVPVVPVHLKGVRPIFPKGSGRLSPGHVEVRFGDPLSVDSTKAGRGEDARHFAARLEAAVAELADEAESDWWSARRRAAAGTTPPIRGPEAASWRRSWALPESARRSSRPRTKSRAKPW
jgi:1-acyl-sn-glycerol-3-phosphate acyltransferase